VSRALTSFPPTTSDICRSRNRGSLKLVVLSLRTGLLHPASSGPFTVTIDVLPRGRHEYDSWSTLYRNLLLYDLSGDELDGELVVVNWTSGITQTVRTSPLSKSSLLSNVVQKIIRRGEEFSDYQALSDTALLVTMNTEDEQPLIFLYQWEATEGAPSPAHVTAVFQLPTTVEHSEGLRCATFSPNSANNISPTSSAEWFVPLQESESQIVVIILWIEPADFLLVILKQVFTRYTRSGLMPSSETPIPWEEWGPQNTRLVDAEGDTSDALPTVCGNFVRWQDRLLDFNQPLLSRDVLASSECQNVRWRDAVTTVALNSGFSGEFSTMLPCRDTPLVLDVIPRGANRLNPGLHGGIIFSGSLV
jgi:hypothetical protein